jgi:nitrite reductase (NADH) small subunit
MTGEWVRVARCEELPEREGRVVSLGGREIALFNLGDRVLAMDNRCPHQQGPLCDGIVTGRAVVCPLHGWKVSLEDGGVQRPSGEAQRVRTYPTSITDGIVAVQLPPADCSYRRAPIEKSLGAP